MRITDAYGIAKGVDPDQTAPCVSVNPDRPIPCVAAWSCLQPFLRQICPFKRKNEIRCILRISRDFMPCCFVEVVFIVNMLTCFENFMPTITPFNQYLSVYFIYACIWHLSVLFTPH